MMVPIDGVRYKTDRTIDSPIIGNPEIIISASFRNKKDPLTQHRQWMV